MRCIFFLFLVVCLQASYAQEFLSGQPVLQMTDLTAGYAAVYPGRTSAYISDMAGTSFYANANRHYANTSSQYLAAKVFLNRPNIGLALTACNDQVFRNHYSRLSATAAYRLLFFNAVNISFGLKGSYHDLAIEGYTMGRYAREAGFTMSDALHHRIFSASGGLYIEPFGYGQWKAGIGFDNMVSTGSKSILPGRLNLFFRNVYSLSRREILSYYLVYSYAHFKNPYDDGYSGSYYTSLQAVVNVSGRSGPVLGTGYHYEQPGYHAIPIRVGWIFRKIPVHLLYVTETAISMDRRRSFVSGTFQEISISYSFL